MRLFVMSLCAVLVASGAWGQTVWIEAESGTLAPTVIVVNDAGASGDTFVQVPEAAVRNATMMTYTFVVPEDGTYVLWARARMPRLPYNAIYVKVDGNPPTTFTEDEVGSLWDFLPSTTWVWDQAFARGAGHADRVAQMQFTLTAGTHTLEVGRRDWVLDIDAFMLTKDLAFVPSGPLPGVADPSDLISLTFSFTEPSDNTDGSAIDDLASCTIMWSISGISQPHIVVPASSPTGGGVRTHDESTTFDRSVDRLVTMDSFCTNATGQDSAPAGQVTLAVPLIPLPEPALPSLPTALMITY